MVSIERKISGNNTYFYLEHSIRKGRRVSKKTLYLGKRLPSNLEKIKSSFITEIYRTQYFERLEKIKQKYSHEQHRMSHFAREKTIEDFSTRFTYDSQRIEGSTLTLLETATLLEKGISPGNKPIEDAKEAEAHKALFYEALRYKKDLTFATAIEWHRILFQNTKPSIAGKIRNHRVGISGSKFIPPLPVEIYPLLRNFFRWYNRDKERLNPVQLSALAHLKFVTVHPFSDGNGRLSRIIMNFVLNKRRYPLFNIPYQARTSYYKALERSQIRKDDYIFTQWFMKNYIRTYKYYLT